MNSRPLTIFLLLIHFTINAQTDSTSIDNIPSESLKDSIRTEELQAKSSYKQYEDANEFSDFRYDLYPIDFAFFKVLIIPLGKVVVPDSLSHTISALKWQEIELQNKENAERNEWIQSYIKKYHLNMEYILPSDTAEYDREEYRYILVSKWGALRTTGPYQYTMLTYCFYDRLTHEFYDMPYSIKDTRYFKEMAKYRDQVMRKARALEYTREDIIDPNRGFKQRIINEEDTRLNRKETWRNRVWYIAPIIILTLAVWPK